MSQIVSLTGNIILTNTTQVIVSFVCFLYNGLFIAMPLGYEWVTYAHQRRGLRVSGARTCLQRSKLLVSLRYEFAILLMVTCGLPNRLVAQSNFFGRLGGTECIFYTVEIQTLMVNHSSTIAGNRKCTVCCTPAAIHPPL